MKIEEFDRIIEYLLDVMAPPNVSDDPPVMESALLDVLEKHCEVLRGKLIYKRDAREWERAGLGDPD